MSVLAKTEILYRCRCCLDDVNLELMWNEISNDGQIETFGTMLLECFSLPCFVKSEDGLPDYICSSCVDRLQSALEFKREIIASEQVLQGFLSQAEVKIEIDMNQTPSEIKAIDNEEIEFNQEEATNPTECSVTSTENEVETKKRKWPKKRKGADRLKVYKKYTQMELREAVKAVNNDKITIKEACSKYKIPRNTLKSYLTKMSEDQNDPNDDYIKDKTFILIEEIKMILKYTNAIPFKTKTAKYYCAYCSTNGPMFPDADELRIHTELHKDERLRKVDHFMRPYWLNEILKLDILNLTCLMCNTKLPEWNDMFLHFYTKHDIEFDEAYTRIIPYNLSEPIVCVLCHDEFKNFHKVDGHMNAHYNNYLCPKCGDSFVANSRLEKHLQLHHQGKYPCKECGKVFTLDKYRAKHFQLVHNKSMIKCELCSDKFKTGSEYSEHLKKDHNTSFKRYTCEYCGRTYEKKPSLQKHINKARCKFKECNQIKAKPKE